MNNNQILRLINFVSNKHQTGNTLTIPEFTDELVKSNLELFKKKIGLPEEYKAGMPLPRVAYEITQRMTGDLAVFKELMGDTTTPLMVDTDGYADLPSDYFYLSYIGFKYVVNNADCDVTITPKAVDILTDAQWIERLGNSITYPTKKHPIANFLQDQVRFMPKDLGRVEFAYIRYPVTPVYDYYISAYDEIVYLEEGETHTLLTDEEGSEGQTTGTTVTSKSIELEWSDVNKLQIINLILDDIGINLREGQLEQYAQIEQREGQ